MTFDAVGKDVYGTLKHEAGVHRLVRISPFFGQELKAHRFRAFGSHTQIRGAGRDKNRRKRFKGWT